MKLFLLISLISLNITANQLTTETIIIDNHGEESFNLIQNTIRKFKNQAIENEKHFIFFIKNSVAKYNENHIEGIKFNGTNKEVVIIEGESKEGVLIYTDGNSMSENFKTPSDYDFVGQENKVLNDIPTSKKHTFWLHESCTVRNLTIHSVDTKYCVHQDQTSTYPYDTLFENVHFIKEMQNNLQEWRVIGIGNRYNQVSRYKDCTAIFLNNTGNETGRGIAPMFMFWHNLANQPNGTLLEIDNCNVINCGLGLFTDVGSNQDDKIIIKNSSTDSELYGISIQNHEVNQRGQNLMNLNFEISNNNIPHFELRDRAGGYENISSESLAIDDYHIYFENITADNFIRGSAIKFIPGSDQFTNANSNDFEGVIWRDNLGSGYYIPKGKTVEIFSDEYVRKGDGLGINSNGIFELNSNQNVAIALEDGIGLIKARLIDNEALSSEIYNTKKEDLFTIFPNPAKDIIKFNNKINMATIFDLQGRVLKKVYNTSEMNISGLESNYYFLKCEGYGTYKLLKK